MLRTVTPKKNAPTADFYRDKGSSGIKVTINGVTVWLKGVSPTERNGGCFSPYYERAAYIVDKMLNLNLVPTTVLRIHNGNVASAQRFIAGTRPEYSDVKPPKLNLFDFIIGNGDRHPGNWIITRDKVWAIDNAYSFDVYEEYNEYEKGKLRESVKKLSKTDRIKWATKIQRILDKPQELHKRLDCLIDADNVRTLISRLEIVLTEVSKIDRGKV